MPACLREAADGLDPFLERAGRLKLGITSGVGYFELQDAEGRPGGVEFVVKVRA